MKASKYTAIDLTEFFSLLAVWELEDGCWEILSITRKRNAIALARESPTTRLVFPTGVKPHGVWGGSYKNRAPKTNSHKVDTLQERRERVLQLLENSPGQTRDALAPQLGVSVATVGQLLRHLENNGDIHHCPHPMQNKTKLYYVGSSPITTTSIGATSSSNKVVPPLRREPLLKVYFVDPQTLQEINR